MKNVIGFASVTLSLIVGGATLGIGAREVTANSMDESAEHRKSSACSNRTLKGTYGIQMQGTRPVPAGTGMEQMIGSGTYVVNADCTGSTLFQPGPGVTIEERMVIIDYGHEVRSITVSPQPLMISTVGKRIGWR